MGTTVLGGALLLVCLTLINKKKGKLIFLVSMLTVGGNLSQVMAFEDFKEIQPVVIKTSIGGMLPSPEEIPGYSFTGYYFEAEKTCTNKSSSIKIEERGEFTPGLVEGKTGIEEKIVVSEKGEPLVQPENPEGVVSEKGEPLVQPENPEAVISEKGEPLVQDENPEAVISEKGEPLVQDENPEAVISEKGEPLVQDENPEYEIKPTPEESTPDVKPKTDRPADESKLAPPTVKVEIPILEKPVYEVEQPEQPVKDVQPNVNITRKKPDGTTYPPGVPVAPEIIPTK